jgi:hypothetical protein
MRKIMLGAGCLAAALVAMGSAALAEPVLEKTSCGPAEIAVYSHTTENFWCAAQVDSVRVVASTAPRKSVATKKASNLTAQRAMGPAFEKGEAR